MPAALKRQSFGSALFLAAFLTPLHAAELPVSGDAVIRGPAGGSEIVITTTSRVAGAIHSLTWNGREFLDSHDHGRQLQSAANFDAGRPFVPEVFNPTEAGSLSDGVGPTSTSRLLQITTFDNVLETTNQMAFWLRPGEKSAGHPALNTTPLSNHRVSKRVQIGYRDLPHVIQYDVTFTVPAGETHTYAQFEAVTGYMPRVFDTFWKFDPESGELQPLDDGPGEQSRPVVLATKSGSHAMGIFSPDQPSPGYDEAGYGRFRFRAERVTKWNSVFRIRRAEGIEPRTYAFRNFVIVGTRDTVAAGLRALDAEFRRR